MQRFFYLSLAALVGSSSADTIGLWRFDDDEATAGGSVVTAANEVSPGTLDATASLGIPLYSDDVPAAEIYDPINDITYTNEFSLDVSGPEARLSTLDDLSFNSSFTVEVFIKMTGEPRSYESVLRRQDFVDRSWQIDFDHAANLGFGRIRTRWDTPAGEPDGSAEAGVDENVNFVLGPQGNATAPKIYIDTGAKNSIGSDIGPQNTGDPADYVFAEVGINTFDTDVALQGDGINDVDEWHHLAMSFDETTGEIKFYFDYLLSQTRTLSDSEGDGYTHPAAGLLIGKLSATPYALLMDELRYSNEILTPGSFLREPLEVTATTTAFWRMEEDDAAEGSEIISLDNEGSLLHPAGPVNGTPTYSVDVPGTTIFDPVSGTSYPNEFSMDSSPGNARVGAASDVAFDTSFTVEMFIKLLGEPGGYHSFMRRNQAADLRWQVDFDSGNMGAYGRIRTRWDTPAGDSDNLAEVGVDENVNFVLGPQGWGNVPDSQRILIDTDLGDGMVASYNDPDNWQLDGDGLNDVPEWHHVAITFDQDTGTIGFYYDYELMQQSILSDSEADGYTHPSGGLQFGKFSGEEYGLMLDEVRYSEGVLASFQFLQATSAPPAPLEISSVTYDADTNSATVVWPSTPGRLYSLDRSTDLELWEELLEEEVSPEETTVFEDTTLPPGSTKVFYRLRSFE